MTYRDSRVGFSSSQRREVRFSEQQKIERGRERKREEEEKNDSKSSHFTNRKSQRIYSKCGHNVMQ